MVRAFLLAFSLAFSLGFLGLQPATAADAFVSVIEDLPLMDGLAENENAAVTFETAGGRIAEAEARGAVRPDAVRLFYADVLPQLGWLQAAENVFERERERLRLTIEPDGDGGAVVGFSVSPIER